MFKQEKTVMSKIFNHTCLIRMETNISEYWRVHDIKNGIIDRLKRAKKHCKYSFLLIAF